MMKKVIIGIITFLVVISIIGYVVLVKIGDYMLSSMIDSELEQLLSEELIPEDSDNIFDPSGEVPQSNGSSVEGDITVNPPNQSTNNSGDGINKPQSEPNPEKNEHTLPNTSTQSQAPSQPPLPSNPPKPTPAPITVDTIAEIKDSVSNNDKAKAATLVLSNLTSSDIKTLQTFLSGGITPEEAKQAKEIAYARFSDEDIKTVKELYYKYMKSGGQVP